MSNRVEELKDFIILVKDKYGDSEEIDKFDVDVDLMNILLTLNEIGGNDKTVYNSAYRAGFRAATIDHLGGGCSVCGNTNFRQLEIEHIGGVGVVSETGRGIADWKDLTVLTVLCGENSKNKCHSKTANYKRSKKKTRKT
jgi:hypothetical protein